MRRLQLLVSTAALVLLPATLAQDVIPGTALEVFDVQFSGPGCPANSYKMSKGEKNRVQIRFDGLSARVPRGDVQWKSSGHENDHKKDDKRQVGDPVDGQFDTADIDFGNFPVQQPGQQPGQQEPVNDATGENVGNISEENRSMNEQTVSTHCTVTLLMHFPLLDGTRYQPSHVKIDYQGSLQIADNSFAELTSGFTTTYPYDQETEDRTQLTDEAFKVRDVFTVEGPATPRLWEQSEDKDIKVINWPCSDHYPESRLHIPIQIGINYTRPLEILQNKGWDEGQAPMAEITDIDIEVTGLVKIPAAEC